MRRTGITTLLTGLALAAAPLALADGAADYKSKCAMCHGADGSGNTPMGKKLELKDLKTSKLTDAEMIELVTKGKNKMPAAKLSGAEIKEVVSYVRGMQKK